MRKTSLGYMPFVGYYIIGQNVDNAIISTWFAELFEQFNWLFLLRFCCDSRPTDVLISESNEMMVIFRSNYSVDPQRNNRQRGFQALVKSSKSLD